MAIKKLQYWLRNKRVLITQTKYYSRMFYYWLMADPKSCPFCGSLDVIILARKRYFIQRLLCNNCKLEYRYPKDRETFSSNFYHSPSVFEVGPNELKHFLKTKFINSKYDFSSDIRVISKIFPQGKLLDYGCSVGAAVYQFKENGYDAVGFDINKAAAKYGKDNLGVEIITDFNQLKAMENEFDVIFTAHTLEHITDISKILGLFQSIIKPGGLLYIRVPNCTRTINKDLRLSWGHDLYDVHGVALTKDFFLHNLPVYGFKPSLYSFNYGHFDEKLIIDTYKTGYIGEFEKEELLAIAIYNGQAET